LVLNREHQLLFCAVDDDLLGENINSTKRSTEALLDASKEVDVKVNAEKTKYLQACVHIPSSEYRTKSQYKGN
jgi:hypothetical protein